MVFQNLTIFDVYGIWNFFTVLWCMLYMDFLSGFHIQRIFIHDSKSRAIYVYPHPMSVTLKRETAVVMTIFIEGRKSGNT